MGTTSWVGFGGEFSSFCVAFLLFSVDTRRNGTLTLVKFSFIQQTRHLPHRHRQRRRCSSRVLERSGVNERVALAMSFSLFLRFLLSHFFWSSHFVSFVVCSITTPFISLVNHLRGKKSLDRADLKFRGGAFELAFPPSFLPFPSTPTTSDFLHLHLYPTHPFSFTQPHFALSLPITMAPTKARLIGSLLFCPTCSTLLDLPGDADVIVCEQCGHEEPAECEFPHPADPWLDEKQDWGSREKGRRKSES